MGQRHAVGSAGCAFHAARSWGAPLSFSVGFTLLELLAVVAIIGLLAGYVAPRFFSQIGKSEIDDAARAHPSTEQGLKSLVQRPGDEPKWSGPYLSKAVPLDPWGRPYLYRQPGEQGRDYELGSFGKDGQAGGSNEEADLSVWDTGR